MTKILFNQTEIVILISILLLSFCQKSPSELPVLPHPRRRALPRIGSYGGGRARLASAASPAITQLS